MVTTSILLPTDRTPIARRSHAAPYRWAVRVRVLGAIELAGPDGSSVAVASPNQRTVLAALAAHRGEVVALDTLVDAVWGDAPPPSATVSLRTYVSRLRAQLGDVLVSRGGGFALDLAVAELDAAHFDDLVDQATLVDSEAAAALLDAALGLWRGPPFADKADVACVRAAARRLGERRLSAVEDRISALLGVGRVADAVAGAEALVVDEPLREVGWALLIEGLAAAHRSAEALRAFQRAARALADAGLEPSARLREAERSVLAPLTVPAPSLGSASQPSAREIRRPPRRSLGGARPASSFVGRAGDCERVLALLERERLVTLVGPGGVGKTRLALEVAATDPGRSEHGTRVVELARVARGEEVPDLVVTALGLAGDGEDAMDVLARARRLELLVVLDNAEHVVGAVVELVEHLLSTDGAMRLLVTSRERLGVDGEHVWSVAPLAVAGHDAPAVRLFLDRARATVGDIELEAADPVVSRIVQRLDGLPLAIEMAAGHLVTATPDELASVLDERDDLLRSPRRAGPSRHRSLTAVLEWSEARLDEREQIVLAELSCFTGAVAVSDVGGVLAGSDVAHVVRSLAARSLVHVDRSGAVARFGLLQTVRSFASRRLQAAGRTGELEQRHAAWFVAVAASADRDLRGPDEARADDRIAAVFAELRAVHRWARAHAPGVAAALSAHLHLYAETRLADEPLRWAEELLVDLATDDPHLAVVLASAAALAVQRGDLTVARARAERALELAGPPAMALPALEVLADVNLYEGHLADSARAYGRLARVGDQAGDAYYGAIGHSGVALARAYEAHPRGPVPSLADVDERPLGPSARGWLRYTDGELLGDRDAARSLAHFDEAVALARAGGNRFLEGVALVSSCSLRARTGDIRAALAAFDTALRHWQRLASTTHQLTTLRNLVVLLQRVDEPEMAAELLGAVERHDIPTYGDEAERLARAASWASARLGARAFDGLVARGRQRAINSTEDWALANLLRLSGPGTR